MTVSPTQDDRGPSAHDVHTRAELLPEERAAGGSADPEAQAAAILAESEARVNAPWDDPGGERDPNSPEYQAHEHRRSEDLV
jgi:hypothetical protein